MKTEGSGPLFKTASPAAQPANRSFLSHDSSIATWVFMLIAFFVSAGASRAAELDSCVDCHRSLPDHLGAPVAAMAKDVHYRYGLSCAECHGGDPTDPELTSMAPEKGFRRISTTQEISDLCGRCHTDQATQYKTSEHGQRLIQGDEKVATCVSCHGDHGMLSVNQTQSPVYPTNIARTCDRCHADGAYMAGYDIPTDQFARYQRSVHGEALFVKRDLSAPTCNDCHGNHGAHPPGVDSVAAACGQCHATTRGFFLKSPHKAAFDRLNLTECGPCHGIHAVLQTSDGLLGVEDVSICVTCHTPESAGYQVAQAMQERLDDFKAAMRRAEEVLDTAGLAGMEVGEMRYNFQEARQALVLARDVVHTFSQEDLDTVVAKGQSVATQTFQAGQDALIELQVRKRRMIIPLVAIGFVVALLYMKIKILDKS